MNIVELVVEQCIQVIQAIGLNRASGRIILPFDQSTIVRQRVGQGQDKEVAQYRIRCHARVCKNGSDGLHIFEQWDRGQLACWIGLKKV